LIGIHLAKLSECPEYVEKFRIAYSYCEANGLLRDIANMSAQRQDIDERIRYKVNAGPGRVTVRWYLFYLRAEIQDRKSGYDKLKKDQNIEHVALCLFKMMEDDLPEKLVPEPTI
jgi:hypothetical protein